VLGKPSVSPEQLLALIADTIRQAPAFKYGVPLSDADMRWLARADALLDASSTVPALMTFRTARAGLGSDVAPNFYPA